MHHIWASALARMHSCWNDHDFFILGFWQILAVELIGNDLMHILRGDSCCHCYQWDFYSGQGSAQSGLVIEVRGWFQGVSQELMQFSEGVRKTIREISGVILFMCTSEVVNETQLVISFLLPPILFLGVAFRILLIEMIVFADSLVNLRRLVLNVIAATLPSHHVHINTLVCLTANMSLFPLFPYLLNSTCPLFHIAYAYLHSWLIQWVLFGEIDYVELDTSGLLRPWHHFEIEPLVVTMCVRIHSHVQVILICGHPHYLI